MREKTDPHLIIRAACPSCKHLSIFKFENKKEKAKFRFSRHDCPEPDCRKRNLPGWEILR